LSNRTDISAVKSFAVRQVGRVFDNSKLLYLHPSTQALPNIFYGETSCSDQLIDDGAARCRQILPGKPQWPNPFRRVRCLKRVTLDVNLPLHQHGECGVESLPVAALAHLAQPIRAQAIRQISTRLGIQKGGDTGFICTRLVVEAQTQTPVLRPWLQHMTFKCGNTLVQRLQIAFMESGSGSDEMLVASGRCHSACRDTHRFRRRTLIFCRRNATDHYACRDQGNPDEVATAAGRGFKIVHWMSLTVRLLAPITLP
jgi:hypothetical protein